MTGIVPDSGIISIHVPREGHDRKIYAVKQARHTFQSTCPARGTTNSESDDQHAEKISIHVPREGHDKINLFANSGGIAFQSTCPARGTTLKE